MLLGICVWQRSCREIFPQALVWTAGGTWFKKAGIWHLVTAWNARQQSQQNELCVWQYQECSFDIPKPLHLPSYSEVSFSALQHYFKTVWLTNFCIQHKIRTLQKLTMLLEKVSLCPKSLFWRRRSRETACTCVRLTYTFTNISGSYWNLTHKTNKEGNSICRTATNVWQDLSHLTLDMQSIGISIRASQPVLLL